MRKLQVALSALLLFYCATNPVVARRANRASHANVETHNADKTKLAEATGKFKVYRSACIRLLGQYKYEHRGQTAQLKLARNKYETAREALDGWIAAVELGLNMANVREQERLKNQAVSDMSDFISYALDTRAQQLIKNASFEKSGEKPGIEIKVDLCEALKAVVTSLADVIVKSRSVLDDYYVRITVDSLKLPEYKSVLPAQPIEMVHKFQNKGLESPSSILCDGLSKHFESSGDAEKAKEYALIELANKSPLVSPDTGVTQLRFTHQEFASTAAANSEDQSTSATHSVKCKSKRQK